MKKFMRFLVPVLLLAMILGSIGWYLFVYDRDFTRDSLLSQARYQDLHGNARLSSWFYDLAYDHSGGDANVAIELANQYKADGNYTKAEFTLTNAIHTGATVELYTALSRVFVEQDKLLDAVTLLENIQDPDMKAQLDALRPTAPEVSHAPGFYSQYIDVTLSASTDAIFYTLDGQYPTLSNPAFSEPISLPSGETKICAVSIDPHGLVSPLTIVSYTVGGVIEPVEFVDEAVEQAMREAIGANSSSILYTNELWPITDFTVPAEARSLEDLRHLIHLEKLTISNLKLSTLETLAPLEKLSELHMAGCSFDPAQLQILAALPSLTKLTLADCNLSTVEALTGAQNLTYLDLQSNTIRNLSPISGMATLKEVYLQHNAVNSAAELAKLPNLEKLDLSYNALTTLAPLAACGKLTWLCADGNQINTVEGLGSLSLLSHLSLDYNQLGTIDSLGKCTELVNLSFANNGVEDIAFLNNLLKLEILDFSYNKVEALPHWKEGAALRTVDGSYNSLFSIDTLNQLSDISYVYMDYNKLTDITALASCYHLVQVNVYGNEIEDVSELTAHNIIVNYDPT